MVGAVKRLGALLMERGMITPVQLEDALEAQKTTREFLGAVLIRRGVVTESQILEALSEQFSMPFQTPRREEIDWTIANQYSSALMTDHTCFPYKQDEETVTAVMANPLDVWAISQLETEAKQRGKKAIFVLAVAQDVRALIQEYHRRTLDNLLNS